MDTDQQQDSSGIAGYKKQIIIGCLCVVIGVALVMMNSSKGKPQRAAEVKKTEDKPKELSQQEKEQLAAKAHAQRSTYLATLQVPDNFPQPLPIYFGSQTGTAEKFCNVLAEEAHELGIDTKVIDFDNFDEEKFPQHELVLAVIATHYEGEPCDNTKHFHKWIRNEIKAKNMTKLAKIKYGIMGLGDSSYEQFNSMANFFTEKFSAMGAEKLVETGLADADKNTTEQDFESWKSNLWQSLIDYYKAKQPSGASGTTAKPQAKKAVAKADPNILPFKVVDEAVQDDSVITPANVTTKGVNFDMNAKHYMKSFDCKVSTIKELRQKPGVGGSTVECIFELPKGVTYVTAANSAIFAPNQAEFVTKFATQHSLNLDHKFKIAQNSEFTGRQGNLSLPIIGESMSVKEFLTTFLDLQSAITKKQLESISRCCLDATEKEEMVRIAASKDDYQKQMLEKNVGLVDLQDRFKSLKLTLDVLVNKCEMIRPRYYTIASSSLQFPNLLTVALSVEKFQAPEGTRTGLVSKYLVDVMEGKSAMSCKIFVKESMFGMPPADLKPAPPMLMVGPGTGIVPFIGFLQELAVSQSKDGNGPETHMYFGCRDKDTDFIYRDFMADMEDKKVLTKLNTAFSRAADGSPKTYVQDVLKTQGEFLIEMMTKRNAYFYICGNNKMGLDVQNLLKELVGEDYYQQIKDEKRLRLETWS